MYVSSGCGWADSGTNTSPPPSKLILQSNVAEILALNTLPSNAGLITLRGPRPVFHQLNTLTPDKTR